MTEESCLFCRIIDREIPAEIVHEDEYIVVFKDINPNAIKSLSFGLNNGT